MTDQPRDDEARAGSHEGAYPPTAGWTRIIPNTVTPIPAPKSKDSQMTDQPRVPVNECGISGCTLPNTHGDEPHSWEHPYHDAPQPRDAAVEALAVAIVKRIGAEPWDASKHWVMEMITAHTELALRNHHCGGCDGSDAR